MGGNAEDAALRLADFGSAVRLKSATDKATFKIGTPGYIAPEMISNKPYSFSVDIWSIGVIMHLLLTARVPFWEEERSKRNKRVCTEVLDLELDKYSRELSIEAKHLLYGMLTKDAGLRLTIDQVLAHPWFQDG